MRLKLGVWSPTPPLPQKRFARSGPACCREHSQVFQRPGHLGGSTVQIGRKAGIERREGGKKNGRQASREERKEVKGRKGKEREGKGRKARKEEKERRTEGRKGRKIINGSNGPNLWEYRGWTESYTRNETLLNTEINHLPTGAGFCPSVVQSAPR